MKGEWMLFMCVHVILVASSPANHPHVHGEQHQEHGQLLYILMDGFRWDYLDQQPVSALPGFTRFLKEGGRARWANPLFPTLSFPTWTTLSTGLHAESHGLVGNYFYDSDTKDVFSLFDKDSTGKQKWWTAEPLWTTAQKAGLHSAQYLWSRCDVPIDNVTTDFCEPFIKIPGKKIFQQNIDRALDKLSEGYELVQVYTEHADNIGHTKGPNSPEQLQAVRDLDSVVLHLLTQLQERQLQDKVNIVIVSDHGMSSTAPGEINRHEIDEYLDASLVENIADKGAFMNIKVSQQNIEKVYEQVSKIPGVKAYKRDDLPEHFHFKHNKYIHEIILLADLGNFIMASRSGKQLPQRNDNFVYSGAHGYSPDLQEMKGIFLAKGPAFKCGWLLEPIHVVDIYQVLTHVLNIDPRPHNGTWSRVQEALATSQQRREGCDSAAPSTYALASPVTAFLIAAVVYYG